MISELVKKHCSSNSAVCFEYECENRKSCGGGDAVGLGEDGKIGRV